MLTRSFCLLSRKKGKGKKISDFYAGQNEHIGNLLKPLKVHTEEAIADDAEAARSVKWAIRLSLYANFILAGLQVSCLGCLGGSEHSLIQLSISFTPPSHPCRSRSSRPVSMPVSTFINPLIPNVGKS
jgi:hypothetical protein